MCGRIVDPNLIGSEMDMSQHRLDPIPRRFNVKPTQEVLILAKSPLVPMQARWGLVPSWHKGQLRDWKAATFNARIEEARDKASFRAVWRFGRCLIPAAGYYEWTGAKPPKQPHFIRPAGNLANLYFAGLASRWEGLLTCTILTRAANPAMQVLHDRMPVILNEAEQEAWLGGTEDLSLGAEVVLQHHPVARFGLQEDNESLIEPWAEGAA